MEELAGWRKSSYSDNGGNCVEAATGKGTILVRDTQDRDGAVLAVSAGVWQAFTAALG